LSKIFSGYKCPRFQNCRNIKRFEDVDTCVSTNLLAQ
jgi:hypothetical protein